MELHVFLIVLVAAVFHASWNTLIKADGDRALFMAAMLFFSGLGGLAAIPWTGLPHAESWPYMGMSILLHQGYFALLLMAYRVGDLSHVYPLSRGSAPLIVALVSTAIIGERLGFAGTVAVILIGVGIMGLSFTRGAQKLVNPPAVLFAFATGLFIAAYTVTDGLGARVSRDAHAYAVWLHALEWVPVVCWVFWTRRVDVVPGVARIWKPALAGGLMAFAAYWTVIWAMSVAPIALVAAVRETSIIFAVAMGVLLLNERLSLARLFGALTTLLGVGLLRLGTRQ